MDQRIINGVIFLDAAQRYRTALESGHDASGKNEKQLALIERLLREACNTSPLLEGHEKEVMGEAWSRFLHSRKPAHVESFVARLSSPELVNAIKKFEPVAKLNRTYQYTPRSIVGDLFGPDFLTLGQQLKGIVQESGMIDYTKGEALVDMLSQISNDIRKERGLPPPKPLHDPSEPVSGLPVSLMAATKKNEVFRA